MFYGENKENTFAYKEIIIELALRITGKTCISSIASKRIEDTYIDCECSNKRFEEVC